MKAPTRPWHPALEVPALFAAALACAWIANATAGPTRRLAWRPERIAPVAVVAPARVAVPAVRETASTPAPPAAPRLHPHREAPAAKPPAPEAAPSPAATPTATATTTAAAWDPAALLARFPPLQGEVSADISGEEARWLQVHGALILDARRSDVYAAGHLPGATSLPVWEDGLAAKIAALGATRADPLLPTVVYCAGGGCEDSHLLAQKLWLAGYRNLRIYAGGFPDWEGRGWPTHKGEQP